jgi:small subunit ribosomal protein S4e
MGKNHMKRLAAPKSWPINKKINTWVARPSTGTHKLDNCISVSFLLKEILKICKTSKEVKYILSKNQLKIDGKIRLDKNFPVGLMDTIQIKDEYYRMFFNRRGKLIVIPIKKEESKIKPKKVINKTSIKGKKLQINLFDGSNIISSKNNINTYDTLIFSEGKSKEKIEFKKGSFVYITGGSQIGKSGVLKEIKESKDLQPKKIIFNDGKTDFETLKDYAFIVGKNKPLISLPNE